MPDVYLALPSLFPNSTEEKKNNGGSLMETSRSEENHCDILVTVFRDTSRCIGTMQTQGPPFT